MVCGVSKVGMRSSVLSQQIRFHKWLPPRFTESNFCCFKTYLKVDAYMFHRSQLAGTRKDVLAGSSDCVLLSEVNYCVSKSEVYELSCEQWFQRQSFHPALLYPGT